MKKTLAIIPARGGSKGIPKKNIAPLAAYPLIAYSIASALASDHIERVIVSTDDDEIAAVARTYNAEVLIRPKALAEDDTRDYPVVKHVLDVLQTDVSDVLQTGVPYIPEYIVFLRPTSPIRPKGFVDAGISKLIASDADALRVVSDPPATPYKMWEMRGERLAPILSDPDIPEAYNAPRQELPKVYWQTGHLDVIRRRTIEKGSITGEYVLPYYIEPRYCVDIDTPENLKQAESQLRQFSTEQIDYPNNMPGICPNCSNHITQCMRCNPNCADWITKRN